MTTYTEIQQLGSTGIIDLLDNSARLTLAQAQLLIAAGVSFGADDRIVIADTAATLEALDAGAIAALGALGATSIRSTDIALSLSIEQVRALADASIAAGFGSGQYQPIGQGSTTIGSSGDAPAITALADGSFATVWSVYDNGIGSERVYYQIQAADGSIIKASTEIWSGDSLQLPVSLAPLGNGGFAACWVDANSWTVRFATIGADGSVLTTPVSMGTGEAVYDFRPEMAVLSNGNVVVTWINQTPGYDLRMQVLGPDGSIILPTVTLTDAQTTAAVEQKVVSLAGGGFALVWTSAVDADDKTIHMSLFDNAGNSLLPETTVSSGVAAVRGTPEVLVHADGSFIILWNSREDGEQTSLHMRAYAADGTAITADTKLSADVPAPWNAEWGADIVALPGGGSIVSWTGSPSGQFELTIFHLNASGAIEGTPFQIVGDNTDIITYSNVVALEDGGYAVAWIAEGDGQRSIQLEVYDQDDQKIGTRVTVDIDSVQFFERPSVVALADGSLAFSWKGSDGLFTRVLSTSVEPAHLTADAAAIGAFELSDIADLVTLDIASITVADAGAVILSKQLAARFVEAGTIHVDGAASVTVKDLGTALDDFSSADIAGLATLGVSGLDATDNAVTLNHSQARAYFDANLSFAANDIVTVELTTGELGDVEAGEWAQLADVGTDLLMITGGAASITTAMAISIGNAGLTFREADTISLADTAANVSSMISTLKNAASTFIDNIDVVSGSPMSLSVEGWRTLSRLDVTFTDSADVVLSDGWRALRTLAATDMTSLAATGVHAIKAGGGDTFGLALLRAMADNEISFVDSGNMLIRLGDTAAQLATLTQTDATNLAALGISEIVVADGAGSFTLVQADALLAEDINFWAPSVVRVSMSFLAAKTFDNAEAMDGMGVDTLVVSATAGEIRSLTVNEITALGGAGIDLIDVTTNAVKLTAAQSTALGSAGIQFATGDVVSLFASPQAKNDSATASEHATATVAVLSNDSCDPDRTLSVTGATVKSGSGAVTVNSNGTLSLTYTGADIDGSQKATVKVGYTISDGTETKSAAATVTFTASAEAGDPITGDARGNNLIGTGAGEIISGLGGNDTLEGRGGDDVLLGGTGLDKLLGGDGADHLTGGQWRDTLTGGKGIDTFIFLQADGKAIDTITDFVATGAAHDLIDLTDLSGLNSFRDLKPLMSQVGENVEIDLPGGGGIVIEKVALAALDKTDFLF